MVTLHAVSLDDAERLYAWRVDPETARQSVAPPPVSLDDHRRWLDGVLRDRDVSLFVAHDVERGVDVGSVRLDRRPGGDIELSITVAPDHRGRGYSHHLIARALDAAGRVRVVARVKPTNVRSVRAFRALGFDGDSGAADGVVWLVHDPTTFERGVQA